MAITKCKECGGQVSTNADACPTCGARLPKRTSTETWFFGGLFALLVIGFMASRDQAPRASRNSTQVGPAQSQESEGRILCRMAIKGAAKNPSTVVFGNPQYAAKDGGLAYFWPRGGGLRMQNSLGAMNDAEALCVAKGAPLRVVRLVIDGAVVIAQ